MKPSKKSLSGFLGLFLLILLMAGASAITTPYGEWSNQETVITISNGTNADYNFYFSSTSPEMNMIIGLYDSSGNLLVTPLDTSIISPYYFNDAPYSITPSDYNGIGDYILKFSSKDQSGPQSSWSIALHVINNAPAINSSPIENVNEGAVYSYDVNASDVNNDVLAYSLTSAPAWLSIDSSIGLITGTAPLVASDTSYGIIISVSDGMTSTAQSYTLVIMNLANGNIPVITLLGTTPVSVMQNNTYNDAGATASDVEDEILTAGIVITGLPIDTSVLGTYTITYNVNDSDGNPAVPVTRIVNVVNIPLGNAPVIALNGENPITITQGGTYTEFGANATDAEDGTLPVTITGTVNTNVAGTYNLIYTATDSDTNTVSITRIVIVVSAPSDSEPSGDVVYSSIDVSGEEEDYLAQITSPPINLTENKASASGLWTTFIVVISVLILGAGTFVVILVLKKR